MDIITKEKVIDWAKAHINDERSNGGECVYTLDGKSPHCIIANFLFDVAPDTFQWIIDNKDEYVCDDCIVNEAGIDNPKMFTPQLVSFSDETRRLLCNMQTKADFSDEGLKHLTWSEVIAPILAESV